MQHAMLGHEAPFDSGPIDDIVFADYSPQTVKPSPSRSNEKQHPMDSFMESVCNIAVGFVISWMVWVWVVAPLFGFKANGGEGFLITCVFTVTSLARQFILRRLFNGRTIWEAITNRDID